MLQRALTQLLRHWFGLSPMGFSVNQQSRTFPTDPFLTFSGKENSRSFPTLDNDIELDSFTNGAIDERIESKAKEHSRSLPTLDNNIELDSFTDVAIDERIESKAKEHSKQKFTDS